ncbi:MAG: FAD-dependent oxidoreductase [Burkholderiaceae bacterium]
MAGLSIGIAGAGLLGRLLAWRLAHAGHRVTVFDPAPAPGPRFDGRQAAGFSAAGMLSPLAEREVSSARVAQLGWRSIGLWRSIVADLRARVGFAERGSLLLAHRSDRGTAQRLLSRLAPDAPGTVQPQALTPAALATLEPALLGPAHAWLLPQEACIDTVAAMCALQSESPGVAWAWGQTVRELVPGRVCVDGAQPHRFDWAIDVRGVAGQAPALVRGVRGETVWLRLQGHGLLRPVRLLHPRHRVYVVPRSADLLIVGASEIESADRSPVSLRSAVELMAAAHSIFPALDEARIERLDVNLRPALPDNEPASSIEPGLVRINGLFRHGWLLAPALVEDVLQATGLAAAQTPVAVAP